MCLRGSMCYSLLFLVVSCYVIGKSWWVDGGQDQIRLNLRGGVESVGYERVWSVMGKGLIKYNVIFLFIKQ